MASVVVVDDELVVRELYASWLRDAGHTVRTAESAEQAQTLLEAEAADVLVTDIRMTEVSGIDLLAWVRQHDPDMPVILITGAPALETAVEALRLGAHDYLIKPVRPRHFRSVVERAVDHRQLLREKQRLEEENRRYQQHLEELVAERTAALQRRTEQLLLLHRVANTINTLRNPRALYERVAEAVQHAFGYMSVAVLSVDWHRECINLEAIAGVYASTFPSDYQQSLHQGLQGLAARENRIIIANDVRQWPEFLEIPGLQTRAQAIFPIRVGDSLVALLEVEENRTNAFDETDEVVLSTLAEHLGVAIANVRLYAELQEALQAREDMLNNVSHELRTPLTLIRGYAELLTEGVLSPLEGEAEQAVSTILEQAHHLTHLVDQLIMFQNLKRQEMAREKIPVAEWLQKLVTSWASIVAGSGLRLEVAVAPGVRSVCGDQDYLQQVMNNLLDNARKFSPSGGTITLRAWQEEDEVYIAVSDQGVGVPPEKLSYLFDRFYQVDGGINRPFGGLGLGLALCQEIVRRHGGRIWAESEGVGKGLTVTFTLPAGSVSS